MMKEFEDQMEAERLKGLQDIDQEADKERKRKHDEIETAMKIMEEFKKQEEVLDESQREQKM